MKVGVSLPVPAQLMRDGLKAETDSFRIWLNGVSRNLDWVDRATSALMYGAVGDGKTDDTRALQALFTNEPYALLPPGLNFLVTDTLFLSHPTLRPAVQNVFAYGATITFANFTRTCTDNYSTTVFGICGASADVSQPFSGWNGRWYGGTLTTAQKLVLFGGCGNRMQVQDMECTLTGSGKACVLLRNNINTHFDHCTFNATAVCTDTSGSGTIWFTDAASDNVPNTACVFLYVKLPQQVDSSGTPITYNGSQHFNDSLQFTSNLFAGGHVCLCDTGSDSHTIRVITGNEIAFNRYGIAQNSGAIIDGNWFENTANSAIYIVGGSPPWWLGTSSLGGVIRGNQFATHNTGVGIEVVFAPQNLFIHNNLFSDCPGNNIKSTSTTGGTAYTLANQYLSSSNSITGTTVFQDLGAGGGGGVSSVTASLPLVSSGGANPNLSANTMVASGASHARGVVPDPGATAGISKFLREDATWVDPTSVSLGAPDILIGGRKKWSRAWADPAGGGFTSMSGTLTVGTAPASSTSENPDWSTAWKSIPKSLWNTGSSTLASSILYTMSGHDVALAAVTGMPDAGGWYFEAYGGFAIHVATFSRMFVGLRSATANIGNNDPSSSLNLIGFGSDAADTQITFMHNDGVGTATKDVIGGGSGYPCHTSLLDFYRFRIWAAPNQTTTINWGITNLTNTPTVEATGTVTTDMPAANTALVPYFWWSQGNQTGTAARIGATLMQCISNF